MGHHWRLSERKGFIYVGEADDTIFSDLYAASVLDTGSEVLDSECLFGKCSVFCREIDDGNAVGFCR